MSAVQALFAAAADCAAGLPDMMELMGTGVVETLYMVCVSTVLSYLFGLPLGVLLYITAPGSICPNRMINRVLGILVNIFRSIPFLILVIVLTPFTRIIVGTSIGAPATIVALTIAATPFIARMVESSLMEIDPGVVEAAESMGTNRWQLIYKVLLPESRPSLMMGAVIAITTILSYSAMAGILGGGGLGAIAINYGLYRYDTEIMLTSVVVLVVLVQVFQVVGTKIAVKIDKRK